MRQEEIKKRFIEIEKRLDKIGQIIEVRINDN